MVFEVPSVIEDILILPVIRLLVIVPESLPSPTLAIYPGFIPAARRAVLCSPGIGK